MAKVSGLSKVKREGNKYTLSWKAPNKAFKDKSKKLEVRVRLWKVNGNEYTAYSKGYYYELSNTATSKSITLNNKDIKLHRENFYPYTDKKIKKLRIAVHGKNTWQAWDNSEFKFKLPKEPTLSAITINLDDKTNPVLSSTLKVKDSTNARKERQRCKYTIERATKADSKTIRNEIIAEGMGEKSPTISWSETNINLPNDGDFIHYTLEAWSQGIRGDSKKKAKREYWIGWAANLEIASQPKVLCKPLKLV